MPLRSTAKTASGDTFQVYAGEFLVNPVPLELSGNWCSHNCAYCFANLNKPDRWADLPTTMRLLSNYQDRKSLEAQYLRWGLPTLISNRVDPFAVTNDAQLLPIMELMADLGLPMAFQTKGGRNIDQALKFLPPSAWYISIPFNDSKKARTIEPGAPSIEDRIELCAKLRSLGHKVNVGINPCVPEWLPDPEKLIGQLKQAGVHGVWVEILHLSRDQDKNLSDKGRQALTPELVEKSKSRKASARDPEKAFADHVCKLARDAGLHPYTMNQHEKTRYWDEYRDIYPVLFPTIQDFVNDCHDQLKAGDFITRDGFLDYFLPLLPEGRHSFGRYIAMNRKAMKEIGKASFTNNLTAEELLQYAWDFPEVKFGPSNNFAFSYALEGDEVIRDDQNSPVLMFHPEGTDQYFAQVVD